MSGKVVVVSAAISILAGWDGAWGQVTDTSAAAATGVYVPAASPVVPAADTAARDTVGTQVQSGETARAEPVQQVTQPDTARASATVPPSVRPDTLARDSVLPNPAGAGQTREDVPDDTSLTARMDVRRGGGLGRAEFPDLRSSAELTKRYAVLLELVERAALGARLTGDSAITLLAPTDSAFARLPAEAMARLRSDSAYREQWLAGIMVRGSLGTKELLQAGSVRSLRGTEVPISRGGDQVVRAADAGVVQPDLIARNGTLHGVDRVILPDTTSASP